MNGRTVLITGASRGIGKAIALELGSYGYNVLVNCRKNVTLAEITADTICRNGGRADVYRADVGDINAVRSMYDYALKTFGFVDTIVNNAGISRYSLFTDEDEAGFNEVIGTNFKGVFNVCRTFIPKMIERKFGRIINIASIWGIVGASCEALYSASKAAVIGLTKSLAKELGPSGITVNAVAPGVIETDMLKEISPQTVETLINDTPVNRCGKVEDVANTVAFLASERSSFVTGEVINCSGGFVID